MEKDVDTVTLPPAEIKWFLIYTPADDFHSLNDKKGVILLGVGNISVGMQVKFQYNNSVYEGIVLNFGTDNDYESLMMQMNVMNASKKPRREASFHKELPRKAATTGREKIQQWMGISTRSEPMSQSSNKTSATTSNALKTSETSSNLSENLKQP